MHQITAKKIKHVSLTYFIMMAILCLFTIIEKIKMSDKAAVISMSVLSVLTMICIATIINKDSKLEIQDNLVKTPTSIV